LHQAAILNAEQAKNFADNGAKYFRFLLKSPHDDVRGIASVLYRAVIGSGLAGC
jgi:hypothetical protein